MPTKKDLDSGLVGTPLKDIQIFWNRAIASAHRSTVERGVLSSYEQKHWWPQCWLRAGQPATVFPGIALGKETNVRAYSLFRDAKTRPLSRKFFVTGRVIYLLW